MKVEFEISGDNRNEILRAMELLDTALTQIQDDTTSVTFGAIQIDGVYWEPGYE